MNIDPQIYADLRGLSGIGGFGSLSSVIPLMSGNPEVVGGGNA